MKRNIQIDFLRGISIFFVIAMHYSSAFPPNMFLIPRSFWLETVKNGYYGVAIFFVISGFLISSISIARYGSLGAIKLSEFYIFRVSRIFPALIIFVCINTLMVWKLDPEFKFETLLEILKYIFTFRFNLYFIKTKTVFSTWAILWSLAIEETYYLLFPLLCRMLKNTLYIAMNLPRFDGHAVL
jgi:peptidoglycan/LPS O-acetylase OafA/YrhL